MSRLRRLAPLLGVALGHPLFTGTPLRVRLYSGWGLSAVEIARVVAFGFLTFWLGFLTLAPGGRGRREGAVLQVGRALTPAAPFASLRFPRRTAGRMVVSPEGTKQKYEGP